MAYALWPLVEPPTMEEGNDLAHGKKRSSLLSRFCCYTEKFT